MKEIFSFSSY